MNIDNLWRSFLNGKNIIFLKALVQETLEAYFNFLKSNHFYEGDPFKVDAFKAAIETRDYQIIQSVYSQKFNFFTKNLTTENIETFDATIITFQDRYRKIIGSREFNHRLQIGEKTVTTIKNFTTFFVAARNIGFHRNIDAHEKHQISDTGFSLSIASDVMTIIETSPVVINNHDAIIEIKKVLNPLLKEIIIKEDPSFNPFEDDLNIKENDGNIEKDKSVAGFDGINNKLDDLLNYSSDQHLAIFTLVDLVKDIISNIEGQKEEIEIILDKQKLEIEESIASKEISLNSHSIEDSDAKKSFTPQQSLNEMLILQRRIKKEFNCENWENLAQGPIRKKIIENKIINKDDFFKDPFIENRYNMHQKEFDKQINSSLGEKFFSILENTIYS